MHKVNVKILGSSSFVSTLNELKMFLKLNPISDTVNDNYKIILFHIDVLQNNKLKDYIYSNSSIKICAGNKRNFNENFDSFLELPASLKEINAIIEDTIAKKKFNINSSIDIKSYTLDKNEKKLSRLKNFVILTEKEIQLLDLFLKSKKPISKDKILSSVWNYSPDADTHTVETHIYRLRKKINNEFKDERFILNNKDGYYL